MTSRENLIHNRDGRFGSKVGQIGPSWDKSGTFSDQISVHLAPGFVPFGANLTHFGAKPTIPVSPSVLAVASLSSSHPTSGL